MDSEVLREACELAGMEIVRWGDGWAIAVREDRFLNPEHPVERPWIESRCADLLVGKVRDLVNRGVVASYALCAALQEIEQDLIEVYATPAQRITAAMAVLKGATDE